MLTRWESWWCLGNRDECEGDLQEVQLFICALGCYSTWQNSTVRSIFASPGLLHCTLIFALPTLALDFTLDTGTHCHLQLFICHFRLHILMRNFLCFLFFRSRFGHTIEHFILASIKILIFTLRQHSTP